MVCSLMCVLGLHDCCDVLCWLRCVLFFWCVRDVVLVIGVAVWRVACVVIAAVDVFFVASVCSCVCRVWMRCVWCCCVTWLRVAVCVIICSVNVCVLFVVMLLPFAVMCCVAVLCL